MKCYKVIILIELEKTNEFYNPVVNNKSDTPCTRSTYTSSNTDSTESIPNVPSAPPLPIDDPTVNDIVINHHKDVTVSPLMI